MSELYVLFRHDTQQWYHSLCPRGAVLWVDKEEHAQYLLKEEALTLKLIMQPSVECLPIYEEGD